MGSFSIWHWLVVFLIISLIFGTKKLRHMGTDLGKAIKGFKEGMNEAVQPEQPSENPSAPPQAQQSTPQNKQQNKP